MDSDVGFGRAEDGASDVDAVYLVEDCELVLVAFEEAVTVEDGVVKEASDSKVKLDAEKIGKITSVDEDVSEVVGVEEESKFDTILEDALVFCSNNDEEVLCSVVCNVLLPSVSV